MFKNERADDTVLTFLCTWISLATSAFSLTKRSIERQRPGRIEGSCRPNVDIAAAKTAKLMFAIFRVLPRMRSEAPPMTRHSVRSDEGSREKVAAGDGWAVENTSVDGIRLDETGNS